MATELVYD